MILHNLQGWSCYIFSNKVRLEKQGGVREDDHAVVGCDKDGACFQRLLGSVKSCSHHFKSTPK
jgi:hypothetical protein